MANESNTSKSERRANERKQQTWQRYVVLALAAIALAVYLYGLLSGENWAGTMSGSVASSSSTSSAGASNVEEQTAIAKDGSYTSRDEVALYINTYGELPGNFLTKNEAKKLGWVASEGNLNKVAPGKSIGGDRFGNYEGLLPDADGREWTECDIDYKSGARGAKRIVFSNDGLIYYTGDHYESFELLYGEEATAA